MMGLRSKVRDGYDIWQLNNLFIMLNKLDVGSINIYANRIGVRGNNDLYAVIVYINCKLYEIYHV